MMAQELPQICISQLSLHHASCVSVDSTCDNRPSQWVAVRFVGLDRTLDLTSGDHVQVPLAHQVPDSVRAIDAT
jgi:hypothetical protein